MGTVTGKSLELSSRYYEKRRINSVYKRFNGRERRLGIYTDGLTWPRRLSSPNFTGYLGRNIIVVEDDRD